MRRRDHQHVADPGEHQGGERVVDHRLVVDRDQLLAHREGDRVQARAGAAGQDDAPHAAHPRDEPCRPAARALGCSYDHAHGTPSRDRRCRVHRLQLRAPRRRAHRRAGDRPRQADLRREPRGARRPAVRPGRARRRRHRRRRDRSSRWSPPTTRSCTSPPSRTTTTRSTTPSRSSGPTWSAPTCCSRPSAARTPASTTSRPTRCTATSSSTTRSASPRTRRTARAAPTPRPRPAPTTWSAPGSAASACGRRSPTAPTTTGPWQHVEKFIPRQITEVLEGRRPRVYGDGRAGPRLDPRRRPQLGRCCAILERGRIGETYLVGADGERNNLEVVRHPAPPDRPPRGRLRPRRRPRRPRPALRDRVRQAAHASSAGSRASATSSRAWPTPSPGTPTTATGGRPHKQATEAAYAAKGQ